MRSVWLHNSLRAGLALALSVLVAKVIDIGHAFWVVLATLIRAALERGDDRRDGGERGRRDVRGLRARDGGHPRARPASVAAVDHAADRGVPRRATRRTRSRSARGRRCSRCSWSSSSTSWRPMAGRSARRGWRRSRSGALVALAASLIMWPKGATRRAARRDRGARADRARSDRARFEALVGRAEPRTVDAQRATRRSRHAIAPTRRSPRSSASAARSAFRWTSGRGSSACPRDARRRRCRDGDAALGIRRRSTRGDAARRVRRSAAVGGRGLRRARRSARRSAPRQGRGAACGDRRPRHDRRRRLARGAALARGRSGHTSKRTATIPRPCRASWRSSAARAGSAISRTSAPRPRRRSTTSSAHADVPWWR